jgi:hypothetical protein
MSTGFGESGFESACAKREADIVTNTIESVRRPFGLREKPGNILFPPGRSKPALTWLLKTSCGWKSAAEMTDAVFYSTK